MNNYDIKFLGDLINRHQTKPNRELVKGIHFRFTPLSFQLKKTLVSLV